MSAIAEQRRHNPPIITTSSNIHIEAIVMGVAVHLCVGGLEIYIAKFGILHKVKENVTAGAIFLVVFTVI